MKMFCSFAVASLLATCSLSAQNVKVDKSEQLSDKARKKVIDFEMSLRSTLDIEQRWFDARFGDYPEGWKKKIDEFVETMASDEEKIQVLSMLYSRYVYLVKRNHGIEIARSMIAADQSLLVRLEAAICIASSGDVPLTDEYLVLEVLRDPKLTKDQKLLLMRFMGKMSLPTITVLADYVKSGDEDYRKQALETLSSIAPKAIQQYNLEDLKSKKATIRQGAIKRMSRSSYDRVDRALIKIISDKDQPARERSLAIDSLLAARSSMRTGTNLSYTLYSLMNQLQSHSDSSLRYSALNYLITCHKDKAVEFLPISLRDESTVICSKAIEECFRLLRENKKEAKRLLAPMRFHKNEKVGKEALKYFQELERSK